MSRILIISIRNTVYTDSALKFFPGPNAYTQMKKTCMSVQPNVRECFLQMTDAKERASVEDEIDIDNSKILLQRMNRLYDDRFMCDVTLVVNGVEFPSHKLILCSASDVFQVMLLRPEWKECGESRVELQELPECVGVFDSFLRYFYTGRIVIQDANIIPLLSLADKYNIKSLEDVCITYMKTHIVQAVKSNLIVSWYQYTTATMHVQVAQMCYNFIKWNIELVSKLSDFETMDPHNLVTLLQQSDLVVFNEMTLFNIVVDWLYAQKREDDDTSELVRECMNHIRFPMMSPRQIGNLLLHPLFLAYKEYFVERCGIGMSFHSLQYDRLKEFIGTNDDLRKLLQPRLYTSDKWSSLLTVDNFLQIQSYYTKTFIFSSRYSNVEHDEDKFCDWLVEVYPKGVWFRKSLLIVWQGTVELPESVLPTVRLTITCKENLQPNDNVKVKIGILITCLQSDVEYFQVVKEQIAYFTCQEQTLNVDNLIPFDKLNPCAIHDSQCQHVEPENEYLIGPRRDTLQMNIIITHCDEI